MIRLSFIGIENTRPYILVNKPQQSIKVNIKDNNEFKSFATTLIGLRKREFLIGSLKILFKKLQKQFKIPKNPMNILQVKEFSNIDFSSFKALLTNEYL